MAHRQQGVDPPSEVITEEITEKPQLTHIDQGPCPGLVLVRHEHTEAVPDHTHLGRDLRRGVEGEIVQSGMEQEREARVTAVIAVTAVGAGAVENQAKGEDSVDPQRILFHSAMEFGVIKGAGLAIANSDTTDGDNHKFTCAAALWSGMTG